MTGTQIADAGSITGNVTGAGATYTSSDLTAASSLAVTVTAGGITTDNISTTNPGSGIVLQAGGVTSDILTGTVNTNSGDILLSAGQNINTGTIANSLTGPSTAGSVGLHAAGSITTNLVDVGEDLRVDAGTTVLIDG